MWSEVGGQSRGGAGGGVTELTRRSSTPFHTTLVAPFPHGALKWPPLMPCGTLPHPPFNFLAHTTVRARMRPRTLWPCFRRSAVPASARPWEQAPSRSTRSNVSVCVCVRVGVCVCGCALVAFTSQWTRHMPSQGASPFCRWSTCYILRNSSVSFGCACACSLTSVLKPSDLSPASVNLTLPQPPWLGIGSKTTRSLVRGIIPTVCEVASLEIW